jgi:Mg-chelatase subunit ChlD
MDRAGYVGRCLLSLLGMAFCTRVAWAQETPCERRTLPISLRDRENLPIQNISVADFEARVHGKPVKVLSLTPDPRPHRLVLLLDTSGSMGSNAGESPLFALGLALAQHFFQVNHQWSNIALVIFNKNVTETLDFTRGNSAVGDKLQQISSDHNYLKENVKGTTALRDAILEGLQLLDHPSSADALYLLTDGGDNASRRSTADVTKRLALTSVRLFVVLLRQASYQIRSPEELSGPDELSEIARTSGGEILTVAVWHGDQVALSANSEAKVKTQETLARLYQAILHDNLLEIELPFPLAKNEHWELRLSDAARRQRKGAQITYPTILIGCNSEVSGAGRR